MESSFGLGVRRPNGFSEYLSRIFHYPQMDIEYTFWQMFHLVSNPSSVYRTTSWHKQTKNQWARDDPGFVAVMILFMAIASLAFAVMFQTLGFIKLFKILFWSIFIDFITVGALIATFNWIITNRYMKTTTISGVDQSVEWLYCFDIHCNSFFPFFLLMYVIQYFLLPLVLSGGFFGLLLSNTLYLVAICYYLHITFLGFHILPFLEKTNYFLYPIVLVGFLYILTLIFQINLSSNVMHLYFIQITHH